MITNIFFDFDGVILETIDIKSNAFQFLFRTYPNSVLKKIKQLHIQNGGMSRYDKFRIIYRDFLGEPLSDKHMKGLDALFNSFCYSKILEAPFVPGIEDFLKKNSVRYKFWIISGAPQGEIRRIVKDRGLAKYFSGVYGSPRSKEELCRLILTKNRIKKREVVFVGDALADLRAAHANSLAFIARIHESNKGVFRGKTVIKCCDFTNLSKLIQCCHKVGNI